ncbi:MAG: signal peptidase I [Acidimicrobiia bacterium]|nr:signal peptidase I [Acidimicrobiia bacterium]NNF88082.1 signal peptidase I [Acidimicrobiia bacterium]NNL12341.1 signal peptidase I [Acidimicrobiia bacterium]NNL96734.1 signal peptidase I [Acidimicrobiia bacterium]RZV46609.1 MAG: signal peptidase I [Acidimicrobiia bacterium]
MVNDPTSDEELPRPSQPEIAADGPEAAPEPESDASILERFEALKQTLGEELGTSQTQPHQPQPSAGADRPRDGSTLDELQDRVRRVKQQERAAGTPLEPVAPTSSEGEGPPLTYEELEAQKQAEAVRARREAKKENRRQRRKNRSFWAELPILVLVALVVAVIIKTFFFQAFYIPSGSMIPTLEINDRVLVNKLSYRFGAVERGDILVFDSPEAIDVERSFPARVFRSIGEATGLTSPETVLIKRVVGLPGDTVAIVDGRVHVNGEPIAEPYLPEGVTMRDFEEVTIPADHVFMMGDNRNQSRDSRFFGAIPRDDIVGRAFVTVWPPGAWTGL